VAKRHRSRRVGEEPCWGGMLLGVIKKKEGYPKRLRSNGRKNTSLSKEVGNQVTKKAHFLGGIRMMLAVIKDATKFIMAGSGMEVT